jgi:hypothetical protein
MLGAAFTIINSDAVRTSKTKPVTYSPLLKIDALEESKISAPLNYNL